MRTANCPNLPINPPSDLAGPPKSNGKTILQILGRSPIHPFPARMAPEIALEALGTGDQALKVLDPMSGSGTVLAVARAKGHRAYGMDIDPLAVLLSRTWTRRIQPEETLDAASAAQKEAAARILISEEEYPPTSDKETRDFIDFWFDRSARLELAALSLAINGTTDATIRDALWCGFSRLIITKSAGASLAMDLSHSRPHRVYSEAPIKPIERFIKSVEKVVANCPQSGSGRIGPPTKVIQGDARSIKMPDESIDLVVTSPPYLNAIDYIRCSKFTLTWMGHQIGELRDLRSSSVGAEITAKDACQTAWVQNLIKELKLDPALSDRDYGLLARYVWDMNLALGEVGRVLRTGGRAVYVVGNSSVRGTFVSNSKITEMVGQRAGLSLSSSQSRPLPDNRRYMPPPSLSTSGDKMSGRMREEVVLVFKKVLSEPK